MEKMNLKEEEEEEEEEMTLSDEDEIGFAQLQYELHQEIEKNKALLQQAQTQGNHLMEEKIMAEIENDLESLKLHTLLFEQSENQRQKISKNQQLVDDQWKYLLETTQDMKPMDKLKAIAPQLHEAIQYTKKDEEKPKGIFNSTKKPKGKIQENIFILEINFKT